MTGLPIAQGVSCGIAQGPCMVSQQCLSVLGRTQGPRSLFPQQELLQSQPGGFGANSSLGQPGGSARPWNHTKVRRGLAHGC